MALLAPRIGNEVSYVTQGCEMLYFTIQNRLQDGKSKVSEAAGAR